MPVNGTWQSSFIVQVWIPLFFVLELLVPLFDWANPIKMLKLFQTFFLYSSFHALFYSRLFSNLIYIILKSQTDPNCLLMIIQANLKQTSGAAVKTCCRSSLQMRSWGLCILIWNVKWKYFLVLCVKFNIYTVVSNVEQKCYCFRIFGWVHSEI